MQIALSLEINVTPVLFYFLYIINNYNMIQALCQLHTYYTISNLKAQVFFFFVLDRVKRDLGRKTRSNENLEIGNFQKCHATPSECFGKRGLFYKALHWNIPASVSQCWRKKSPHPPSSVARHIMCFCHPLYLKGGLWL